MGGLSCNDFYPRSPCGERLDKRCEFSRDNRFLSTLSLRRATARKVRPLARASDFYPRSPCGERPLCHAVSFSAGRISIHALLAESDIMYALKLAGSMLFLSTLSLRRATRAESDQRHSPDNFYPRSPCGERLYLVHGQRPNWRISIHALLAESDYIIKITETTPAAFLSTLSLRRATVMNNIIFMPREFLSTLSLRRATYLINTYHRIFGISIHALLAESDE